MKENLNPFNEPYPDYEIIYEVIFLPSNPRAARFEIWLEKEGYIAVLFNQGSYKGLGHEPKQVTLNVLIILLEAISAGKMMLCEYRFMFWKLSAKAMACSDLKAILQVEGYDAWWIHEFKKSNEKRVTRFEGWS